jgi:hypothetical protein
MGGVDTERTPGSTLTRGTGHSELDQFSTGTSRSDELKPKPQGDLHKR